eukprot:scaffold28046_cov19-Tisochrysis_lutea.AAC.1
MSSSIPEQPKCWVCLGHVSLLLLASVRPFMYMRYMWAREVQALIGQEQATGPDCCKGGLNEAQTLSQRLFERVKTASGASLHVH